MDAKNVPCMDRINKLIKDLYDHQIETIFILADRHGDWTQQLASDMGLKFLSKQGLLQSQFKQFCADFNRKALSIYHLDVKAVDNEDQLGNTVDVPVTKEHDVNKGNTDGLTENTVALDTDSIAEVPVTKEHDVNKGNTDGLTENTVALDTDSIAEVPVTKEHDVNKGNTDGLTENTVALDIDSIAEVPVTKEHDVNKGNTDGLTENTVALDTDSIAEVPVTKEHDVNKGNTDGLTENTVALDIDSIAEVPVTKEHDVNKGNTDGLTENTVALDIDSIAEVPVTKEHDVNKGNTDGLTENTVDTDSIEICTGEEEADDAVMTDDQNVIKLRNRIDNYHTLIGFLKAGLKGSPLNGETMNSVDRDNGHRTVNRSDLINRVVEFYSDISMAQKTCAMNGYRCDLCNLVIRKKMLKRHLLNHKAVLDCKMVMCDHCTVLLPDSYLGKHRCVQDKSKSLPKNVTKRDHDIRYDIALIETRYRWQDFTEPIDCEYCDASLKDVSDCREHLVRDHLHEFHCQICESVMLGYAQITQHMTEHALGKIGLVTQHIVRLDRKERNFSFSQPEVTPLSIKTNNMTEHTLGKIGLNNLNACVKGEWQCSQCQRKFVRKFTLRRHIEQIHGPVSASIYSCDLCKKKFKSEDLLKKHKTLQKCLCNIDNCKVAFPNSLSLKKHQLVHHKDFFQKNKQFLCNICGIGFQRSHVLTAHLEWKHNVGEPEHCNVCGKTFRGKVALSNHKASHRNSLKYQCEICGNSYKQRSGLYKHKQSCHRDDASPGNIYCCEICGKTFMKQISFTHHLISKGHGTPCQPVNEASVLVCGDCGKKFGIKDKLERHIASVHKQIKQYRCNHCDKSFSDKSNYRQHLNVHTGNKPYCSVCKKSFRSQLRLKQHTAQCHKVSKNPNSDITEGQNGVVVFSNTVKEQDHYENQSNTVSNAQCHKVIEIQNGDITEGQSSIVVQSNTVKQLDHYENQSSSTNFESKQYTLLTGSSFVFNS